MQKSAVWISMKVWRSGLFLWISIYMYLLQSEVSIFRRSNVRVNCACMHIVLTALPSSAEFIYNSRWCSDSPAQNHHEIQSYIRSFFFFFYFKAFFFHIFHYKFSEILHMEQEEQNLCVTQRPRGAFVFEFKFDLVLHSSARDGVPCAGPVVTHELRHR